MGWILLTQLIMVLAGIALFSSMKRLIDWQQTRIDYWYECYKETLTALDKLQGGE